MPAYVAGESVEAVSEALVFAVAQHAERQANLISAYLRGFGPCTPGEIRLPAAALLELAAVLEIGLWEQLGLRPRISCDLPSYRQAADELAARCEKGPAEFECPDASSLSSRVVRVWIDNFAWEAPDILGTEIVVDEGDQDDDDFLDLLAEYVWTHRHELQHLISEKRQAWKGETRKGVLCFIPATQAASTKTHPPNMLGGHNAKPKPWGSYSMVLPMRLKR